MNDSLGERMKTFYEDRWRAKLPRRTPVILRLDGQAFHTFTNACERPFDHTIIRAMQDTASYLVQYIQGAKIAYTQSDEISILLVDYDNLDTSAWFDYNVQKMVSISAAMASVTFNGLVCNRLYAMNKTAFFDARAFSLPKEEVANYFVWRQKDWMRNSLSMLAQEYFSSRELHGKNNTQRHEMLHGVGVNWANLDPVLKNGSFITRAGITHEILMKERDVIERHVYLSEGG